MNNRFLYDFYNIEYYFNIVQISMPKVLTDKTIPGLAFFFACKFFRMIHKARFDIIYTRNPWFFAIVTILLGRNCFFESHQHRFNSYLQTAIYRYLVKKGVDTGNGSIVCISNELKNKWIDYHVDKEKLHVAHDGVNIKKYRNTVLSKKKARETLNINAATHIITYTGSLLPGKGVDILIKAANLLPDFLFIIVGGSKEQIFKLRGLKKYNNINFIGYVPPSEIPVYQNAADILALPNCKGSVIDEVTSPIKLFEYLASGRPIVATNTPSLLEILEHDYNALISPAGDHIKLAANIKRLTENPDLCKKLADNAGAVVERFSWDSRVKSLTEVFNRFSMHQIPC